MRKKYLFERRGNEYLQDLTRNLIKNYNPDNLIENNPPNSENTSYVEDKGAVFAVCLREKASGKNNFHDRGILEYVLLHELAHLSTKKIGHESREFWINFKILTIEAVELGIHKPVDYKHEPTVYCSLHVDYNPYFDKRVPVTLWHMCRFGKPFLKA